MSALWPSSSIGRTTVADDSQSRYFLNLPGHIGHPGRNLIRGGFQRPTKIVEFTSRSSARTLRNPF
jgi:hypothetical protein